MKGESDQNVLYKILKGLIKDEQKLTLEMRKRRLICTGTILPPIIIPPNSTIRKKYIMCVYIYVHIYIHTYIYVICIGSGIISNTKVTENTQKDVCRFYPVMISFYIRDFYICGLWCSWETYRCHHFRTVIVAGPGSKFTLA